MQDILGASLKRLKRIRKRRIRILSVLLILSLLVSLDVFWMLRQPGVTLAGDASCKILEHTHDADCQHAENKCDLQEHVHTLQCYSDKIADTETLINWQKMFESYPYTGELGKDLAGIAKTQVGYRESELNFEVGNDGVRRGYTRYGAWYGTPYREWSAAFVSFCLNYAKADLTETPANIGANSMAEMWRARGKFAPKNMYSPTDGDLVFFNDNTVGIIARAYNAMLYVIRGDVNDAVSSSVISVADKTITGWGLTETTMAEVMKESMTIPHSKDPTDISNGPQFSIIIGSDVERIQGYSLRLAEEASDLLTYLKRVNGDYTFTLLDLNNQELPKDDNGNYIAYSNTRYKLTLTVHSPDGFLPGTYQYQIPNGLLIDGGEGIFKLANGLEVGTWHVSDTGLITMDFNDHMDVHTDIVISATMGMHFYEQEEPLDFDGKITVKVDKPTEDIDATVLNKWGSQGNAAEGKDPSKLYWTALIQGNADSQIPGAVLSDTVLKEYWSEEHRYTESDMAAGISIGVEETDPVTGNYIDWHGWTVYPGDPNLTWTETGWSYTIPKTIKCWCGEVKLGNEGWTYHVNYTSTPYKTALEGEFAYTNIAEVDGQKVYGWASFIHGTVEGVIEKKGDFIGDVEGGAFIWEVMATIPGMKDGEKADYSWFVMDYMDIRDAEGNHIKYIDNDAFNSTVTTNYNGTTIIVPSIEDATYNDPFAWHAYWSADHNDGIYYGRQLNILCRCNCTAETCIHWQNGKCASEYWFDDNGVWKKSAGFCQCWTVKENTTFNFTYKTDDITLIQNYGGVGNQLRNEAILFHNPTGTQNGNIREDATHINETIPGMFKKELVHDFDGYTASYRITVNESKIALTNGEPFTIHDVMTQTLAFVNGSMIIKTEDANGNIKELQQDVDYTLTYDGTGKIKDEEGNPVHTLEIEILHPQPVMYTLDFDTALIIPSGTTSAVKYHNSAWISIWGSNMSSTTVEKVYADITISAKMYMVEMHKISNTDGKYLPGATFGLFNEHGNLITTGTTGADGIYLFKTNVTQGIILREHVLYYTQELKAPEGYQLDETKHWFCFCDSRGPNCNQYSDLMIALGVERIPFDEIGHMHIMNERLSYNLPETGGAGTQPIILVSVIFIVTPLVYRFILRRKRERRRKD